LFPYDLQTEILLRGTKIYDIDLQGRYAVYIDTEWVYTTLWKKFIRNHSLSFYIYSVDTELTNCPDPK